MDIKDVMVKKIITVNPTTKIRDAVELMNKNQIGCLVVTRKGKPVGIMTERDVLKKIVCRCKNPEQTRVSEIMSKPLIVGSVDMDWLEAVKLMLDRNIKKLPILDDERLVGLVTLTDIARNRYAYLRHTQSPQAVSRLTVKRFFPHQISTFLQNLFF
jgi:CBS domain-containing protein